MLVSILIPCYNAEAWIQKSILSALQQTYQEKEVVVVDDGSTDNSWEIIQGFGKSIVSKRTSNRGAGATRNYLLQLSKGDWLQYLDADDFLLPGKINNQIAKVESNQVVDIIYSPSIIEERWSGEIKSYTLPIPEPHDPWILLTRWYLPQTGSVLWKKQAIGEVGGWKEDQPCCQEHELYLRLLKAGKVFKYSQEPGAIYRKWSDDTVCERDKSESYKQRLKIILDVENYLDKTGKLTSDRQNEINQARFECARIIWNMDKKWAKSLIREVNISKIPFTPSGKGVPYIYRILYSSLGFSAAEYAAYCKRICTSFIKNSI